MPQVVGNRTTTPALTRRCWCVFQQLLCCTTQSPPLTAMGPTSAAGRDVIHGIDRSDDVRYMVETVQRHAGDAAVQHIGCTALAIIAHYHVENTRRIAAGGGITAVLSAMRNHRVAAAVQEQACWALWNIAVGNAENTASIGSNGGIADVITAMQTHGAVAAVQENGCWRYQALLWIVWRTSGAFRLVAESRRCCLLWKMVAGR